MSDIFDEVDEELRADKAQEFLKRYGGLLTAAAAAVIAAVGAWEGWQYWQSKQDVAAASAFISAATTLEAAKTLDADARKAGAAAFDAVAASAPNGYRLLARFQSAALKADAGDLQSAVAMWDGIAADSSADPLLRDLATILSMARQIDQGDASRAEARLRPLTETGNPWRPLAREQLALLSVREGKFDEARSVFEALATDTTAPAGVRNRATAMLSRLSLGVAGDRG